jgi:hypothetical protein
MLNVHTRPSLPRSRRILLAATLLATGLVATVGFSIANPSEAPMSIDRPASVQFAQATPSTGTSVNEKDAIQSVMTGYYEAFGRDSAAASGFFTEPALIVAPNGSVLLNTRADVAAALEKLLVALKRSEFSHSRLVDRRIKLLTSTTALCGGIAIRMKTDDTEINRAGWTYLLRKTAAGWQIHGIIATDPDKLISAD